MSDSKMANNYADYLPAEPMQFESSVVQSLHVDALSEADAEHRLRAKLKEFAAELQTIQSELGVL